MCNACGFYCCASDEFDGCGCEGCYKIACLPAEDEGNDEDNDEDDLSGVL